jgi:hypothetical protein
LNVFWLHWPPVRGLLRCSFCQRKGISTEGLALEMDSEWSRAGDRIERMTFRLQLPKHFPEDQRSAFQQRVESCLVKRHILNPRNSIWRFVHRRKRCEAQVLKKRKEEVAIKKYRDFAVNHPFGKILLRHLAAHDAAAFAGVLLVLGGAVLIGLSSIFFKLAMQSGVDVNAGGLYRC